MTFCQHWPYLIPGKFQVLILPIYQFMEKISIDILLDHYGKEKPALTLNNEETMKPALIHSEVRTEWIAFRNLLAKKPKDDTALQLKDLITNEMLNTMFPNLHKLRSCSLCDNSSLYSFC